MLDQKIAKMIGEIFLFVSNNKTELWLKQTEIPFCFLKFHPEKRQITVCRWGFSKRPRGTQEIYWQRLEPKGTYCNDPTWEVVVNTITRWDKIWDNIVFNKFESEKMPELLPNSRFSEYIPRTESNVFFIRR